MSLSYLIGPIVLALILARWAVEIWLGWLNHRHVLAHAQTVPEALASSIDPATYAKSVQYTLAKSRFSQIETAYGLVVLLAVLFSGALPWAFYAFTLWLGESIWALA